MRKSQKVKLEEYMRRKAEDRREKQHLENSKDYQPEVEGFVQDRR
jgi:hypothetical protein